MNTHFLHNAGIWVFRLWIYLSAASQWSHDPGRHTIQKTLSWCHF